MDQIVETISFLGTAGTRVMVTKQFLASGGAWLSLGGSEILIDPGPGCLVHALKRKLDPTKLTAIILSHKHLDHSADINIMIEAMTEGGMRRRGVVFAPADALEDDPVIFSYLRAYPQRIEILAEGKSYAINDISLETPIRHRHPVETYGLIFRTPAHTFSWIVDSRYFDNLPGYYCGELLILNVVRLKADGPYDHLSVPDAKQIIRQVKPKLAIITHFGMTMWRARPWEIAKQLTCELGIPVIAARDGMKFDLGQLNPNKDSQHSNYT